MISLNNYILEKLHINKESNPKIDFKKDERMLGLSIYHGEKSEYIRLYVFSFIDIKKESNGFMTISYKNTRGSTVTQQVEINSKGYYEMNISAPDTKVLAVFLPIEYGIDFLDKNLENYDDRNNIYKYFDDDDQILIDKIYDKISIYNSADEIEKIKKILKNAKH